MACEDSSQNERHPLCVSLWRFGPWVLSTLNSFSAQSTPTTSLSSLLSSQATCQISATKGGRTYRGLFQARALAQSTTDHSNFCLSTLRGRELTTSQTEVLTKHLWFPSPSSKIRQFLNSASFLASALSPLYYYLGTDHVPRW